MELYSSGPNKRVVLQKHGGQTMSSKLIIQHVVLNKHFGWKLVLFILIYFKVSLFKKRIFLPLLIRNILQYQIQFFISVQQRILIKFSLLIKNCTNFDQLEFECIKAVGIYSFQSKQACPHAYYGYQSTVSAQIESHS